MIVIIVITCNTPLFSSHGIALSLYIYIYTPKLLPPIFYPLEIILPSQSESIALFFHLSLDVGESGKNRKNDETRQSLTIASSAVFGK